MKIIIAILLLSISYAFVKVIPYPKEVEFGNETLEFSRCSFAVEVPSDKSFTDLFEYHKNVFLGDQSLCLDPISRQPYIEGLTTPIKILKSGSNDSTNCNVEAYELEITKSGIKITSECPVGFIRAMASFIQLSRKTYETHNGMIIKENIVIEKAPIKIKDAPRFEYRGIMVDTSRHFIDLTTLMKIIDGMMLSKISVMHWHISDDDSFPMQSKSNPGLGESGAFSSREIYTVDNIKLLVEYGKRNGVRIIPEIDVPGHTRAIGKFKPLNDLLTCYNSVLPHNLNRYYKIHGGPPSGVLDPSMDRTYQFMKEMFDDLIEYFNDDLIHLGGDEVMYGCWQQRQSIKQFMDRMGIKDYPGLMNYFINRTRDILTKINGKKKTVYWCNKDTFKMKYKDGDVLQFWGPTGDIHQLTSLYPNQKFILSPFDLLYLDCGVANKYGGPSWCGNYKTWLQIYNFEPTNYSLPESMILGAEGCAWAEQIDDANIELKFWPRMAAMAETLWQPKRTKPVNMYSLVTRLNALSQLLNEKGIPSNPVTTQYCEIHTKECFGGAY